MKTKLLFLFLWLSGITLGICQNITLSTNSLTGAFSNSSSTTSAQTFTALGTGLTANVDLSISTTDWELSLDNAAFSSMLSLTRSGTTLVGQPVTVFVRLKSGLTAGFKTATLTASSTGATNQTITLAGVSGSANAFVTNWITDNTQIIIPTTGTGYNYDVTLTNLTTGAVTTLTAQTGNVTFSGLTDNTVTYQVAIIGTFPRIYFNNETEIGKIRSIAQWGNIAWTNMNNAFFGCNNLGYIATDTPNLLGVSDMSYMLKDCTIFNGNISNWNTTNVTNMSFMFSVAAAFNQPIGAWNTQNVIDMSFMFQGAIAFNQPLNTLTWNTQNVTNMQSMFDGAIVFNQPIGNWNTQNVTNMSSMFQNATAFNQPIGAWNTQNVTNMSSMFTIAISFNQPLNTVTWNTQNVTDMSAMFQGATAFNQSISNWNTQNVTTMLFMFLDATAFNQNLGAWNVTNLDAGNNTGATSMLDNCGMNTANYDATLIGWASQNVKTGVFLGAIGRTYCAGVNARTTLASAPKNWTITDDVLSCPLPITLLSFEGKRTNENNVLLQWKTATELNNKGFEVQKSNNVIDFKKITFVDGAGNSSVIKNYSLNIQNSDDMYYRLKQIDFDGSFSYSNIIFVKGIENIVNVYPNPTT
ncbi:MAG: BspA family leucine-rich repeat surface protein, partial [Cytophagales bacterium]